MFAGRFRNVGGTAGGKEETQEDDVTPEKETQQFHTRSARHQEMDWGLGHEWQQRQQEFAAQV